MEINTSPIELIFQRGGEEINKQTTQNSKGYVAWDCGECHRTQIKNRKEESNGSAGRGTAGRKEFQGKRIWFDFMMVDNKDFKEKVVFKSPQPPPKHLDMGLRKYNKLRVLRGQTRSLKKH